MKNELYRIIKESVKRAMNEDIKKGDVFRMDVPERMARKILAQKYGVSPDDFKFDGFKTYTYTPAKRAAKKKEYLGRGKDESHEDYANRVRKLNKNFADAETEIEGEEWRPLSNTGRYFGGNTDYTKSHEISNMGRVRTIDYKDPMRSRISTGYDAPTRNARQFHLDTVDDSGKSFKTTPPIHTMVADAWLDEPEGGRDMYDVEHIDGDYNNNRASNLRYRVRKGNRGATLENRIHRIIKESVNNILLEASDPTAKVQALIDQANAAYQKAAQYQDGDEYPLMDRKGESYGLTGPIKLFGHGYIYIPFNAWKYSGRDYTEPIKIRILTKAGGRVRFVPGDWDTEGWKDARKMLNDIIKDAERGIGHFQNYDPNWETAENEEEYQSNVANMKAMNKQLGLRSNTGKDYIEKRF